MFHDPHSKVFAVFIEAFIGLIAVHGCDLVDWFQICLVRLLNKVGMDVLSPLQGKITMALVAMRYAYC
jgi:CLIP-associating protein 1/2